MWELLVNCPIEKKSVKYWWMNNLKYAIDSALKRFKVKLMAKCIYYTKIFTPSKSLKVNLNWFLQQFNAKNIFFYNRVIKKTWNFIYTW